MAQTELKKSVLIFGSRFLSNVLWVFSSFLNPILHAILLLLVQQGILATETLFGSFGKSLNLSESFKCFTINIQSI